MKHSSLVAFLEGSLSPEGVKKQIAGEVDACNAAIKAGESGHIVIGDGPQFEVTRDAARRLLAGVADGRLSVEIANYLADCIIMSDDFDFADDTTRNAIFIVADDSRPPTRRELSDALTLLG